MSFDYGFNDSFGGGQSHSFGGGGGPSNSNFNFTSAPTNDPSWGGGFGDSRGEWGDPLREVSGYLESSNSGNRAVVAPLCKFELHQHTFVPLTGSSGSLPIVSLAMVNLEVDLEAVNDGAFELRQMIIKHVLKEVLRLRKWKVLLISRVNQERDPRLDPLYQTIQKNLAASTNAKILTPNSHSFQIVL